LAAKERRERKELFLFVFFRGYSFILPALAFWLDTELLLIKIAAPQFAVVQIGELSFLAAF